MRTDSFIDTIWLWPHFPFLLSSFNSIANHLKIYNFILNTECINVFIFSLTALALLLRSISLPFSPIQIERGVEKYKKWIDYLLLNKKCICNHVYNVNKAAIHLPFTLHRNDIYVRNRVWCSHIYTKLNHYELNKWALPIYRFQFWLDWNLFCVYSLCVLVCIYKGTPNWMPIQIYFDCFRIQSHKNGSIYFMYVGLCVWVGDGINTTD